MKNTFSQQLQSRRALCSDRASVRRHHSRLDQILSFHLFLLTTVGFFLSFGGSSVSDLLRLSSSCSPTSGANVPPQPESQILPERRTVRVRVHLPSVLRRVPTQTKQKSGGSAFAWQCQEIKRPVVNDPPPLLLSSQRDDISSFETIKHRICHRSVKFHPVEDRHYSGVFCSDFHIKRRFFPPLNAPPLR